MMMALLFCIFLCPHSADAFLDDCFVSQPDIECQDMCDCSSPSQQDEYCLESCVYELRDDAPLSVYWNLVHFDWAHIALSLEKPQHTVCYSDLMARVSSHSFAIRHLDTIILRV